MSLECEVLKDRLYIAARTNLAHRTRLDLDLEELLHNGQDRLLFLAAAFLEEISHRLERRVCVFIQWNEQILAVAVFLCGCVLVLGGRVMPEAAFRSVQNLSSLPLFKVNEQLSISVLDAVRAVYRAFVQDCIIKLECFVKLSSLEKRSNVIQLSEKLAFSIRDASSVHTCIQQCRQHIDKRSVSHTFVLGTYSEELAQLEATEGLDIGFLRPSFSHQGVNAFLDHIDRTHGPIIIVFDEASSALFHCAVYLIRTFHFSLHEALAYLSLLIPEAALKFGGDLAENPILKVTPQSQPLSTARPKHASISRHSLLAKHEKLYEILQELTRGVSETEHTDQGKRKPYIGRLSLSRLKTKSSSSSGGSQSAPAASSQHASTTSPESLLQPVRRTSSLLMSLSGSPFTPENMVIPQSRSSQDLHKMSSSPSRSSPGSRSPSRRSFSELWQHKSPSNSNLAPGQVSPFSISSKSLHSSQSATSSHGGLSTPATPRRHSLLAYHRHSGSAGHNSTTSVHSADSFNSVKETTELERVFDSRTGRKMINKYMVVRELGRGCHGKVKLCIDTETQEEVAIKIVEKHSKRRFGHRLGGQFLNGNGGNAYYDKIRKEIAILKKLNHPYVVRLKEVIDNPDAEKIYLVLEYLAGGEVRWHDDSIPSNPVMSVDECRRIFRDLLCGVEYLHYQGVLHRDIKPANLLWTADHGHIKISDFGVSCYIGKKRLRSRRGTEDGITATNVHHSSSSHGLFINDNTPMRETEEDDLDVDNDLELAKTAGSPAFFAPEVCGISDDEGFMLRDDQDDEPPSFHHNARTAMVTDAVTLGKAIDVWAMGVTLYCFLFGRVPFMAESEFELFRAISRRPFQIPREHESIVDDDLDDLLERIFDKNPMTRITIDEIKQHPWVTGDMSKQERMQWLSETDPSRSERLNVTEEEVSKAVSFLSKIKKKMRKLSASISHLVAKATHSRPSTASSVLDRDHRLSYQHANQPPLHQDENQSQIEISDDVAGSRARRRTRSLPSVHVSELRAKVHGGKSSRFASMALISPPTVKETADEYDKPYQLPVRTDSLGVQLSIGLAQHSSPIGVAGPEESNDEFSQLEEQRVAMWNS